VRIGGAATIVAAIAVAGAVSAAQSIALKDSSGVPAGSPVVVPSRSAAVGGGQPRVATDVPEVIPAPAPLDVTTPTDLQTPAKAGSPSERVSPKSLFGLKKKSQVVSDHSD